MSKNEFNEVKTLGERVGFAPTKSDEKHIVTICNDREIGVSDTIRRGLKLYYDMHSLGLLNDVRRLIDEKRTQEYEKLQEEVIRLREENQTLERRTEQ
mgnify:CR=1 FL=1